MRHRSFTNFELTQNGPTLDYTALVMWASSDPLVDAEVAKLNPAFFANFMVHTRMLHSIKGHEGVARAIILLKVHSSTNGGFHVNWTKVFAKLYAENFVGMSVKRLDGLRSLIKWLFRNTGWGTPVTFHQQQRLISFLLSNRYEVYCTLRYRREKTLINMLKTFSDFSGVDNLNWDAIVSFLIRKRRLFKVYVPEHPDPHCDFILKKNSLQPNKVGLKNNLKS